MIRDEYHTRRLDAMGRPEQIRNICVIAHVDHGKTTLTDCLLSSNKIISRSLAGKLRFMDSREDEQEREITMKSSSISLVHESPGEKDGLVNLIDSPGHVDFSFEVSSGLKVCDNAVLVVDVLEGACSQTRKVLNVAVREGLKICLLINKVDKLFSDPTSSPEQVLFMLDRVLTQANAALALAYTKLRLEEDLSEAQFEKLQEENSFSPLKGNVIFASSFGNWAFTIDDFTKVFAQAMGGANPDKVKQFMWGDFYFSPKDKKILKKPLTEGQSNIFTQFILKNISNVYSSILLEKDKDKLDKISTVLKIEVPVQVASKLDSEPQIVVAHVMSNWLPLSTCFYKVAYSYLLSPQKSQAQRINNICKAFKKLRGNKERYNKILPFKEALEKADPNGPLIAYISKMIFVPNKNINEKSSTGAVAMGGKALAAKMDQTITNGNFFAFTRVFSGKLKVGDKIFLLTSSTEEGGEEKTKVVEVEVNKLCIWMGYHLDPVEEVGPGCICALPDLGDLPLKFATLSSSPDCPLLNKIKFEQNLLKVSVRTKELQDMPKLAEGLKILKRVDPAIEMYYDEKGDTVLEASGEVHLDRCIKDLEDEFAKVEIVASEPIVTFKETIISKKMRRKIENKKNMIKKIKHENEKAFKEDNKKLREKPEEEKKDEKQGAETSKQPSTTDTVQDKISKTGESVNSDKQSKIESTPTKEVTQESPAKETPQKEENDEVKKTQAETEEADKAKLYRWNSVSSSFFDTTSEEEPEDPQKAIEEFLNDESDRGVDKKDETDTRFIYRESNFIYQKKRIEDQKVVRKGTNLKMGNQGFLGLQRKKNHCEVLTQNKKFKLQVRALGLGIKTSEWLFENRNKVKKFFGNGINLKRKPDCLKFLKSFITLLEEENEPAIVRLILKYLISFGPQKTGPNLLLCKFAEPQETLTAELLQDQPEYQEVYRSNKKSGSYDKNRPDYEQYYSGISYEELLKACHIGFEIALENGPLCAEEMYGCIFIIEDFVNCDEENIRQKQLLLALKTKEEKEKKIRPEVLAADIAAGLVKGPQGESKEGSMKECGEKPEGSKSGVSDKKGSSVNPDKNDAIQIVKEGDSEQSGNMIENGMSEVRSKTSNTEHITVDPYGPIATQLVSAVKKGCTDSFLGAEPRLVQGVLLCTVVVDELTLGSVLNTLAMRRAKIIENEYEPLANMFVVKAHLAIQESFGFFDTIMRLTSGKVSPQLEFAGWEIIDTDPFYQPKTLEVGGILPRKRKNTGTRSCRRTIQGCRSKRSGRRRA
jgi:small GTP-binding protein